MNDDRPTPADARLVGMLNRLFYDIEAERYDADHPEVIEGDARWWSARAPELLRTLRSQLTPHIPVRILDVGCGTGFVSSLLLAHLRANDLVVGVDQSEGMLRRARTKLDDGAAGRVRLVRGDVARLHFRSASFDLLTVNSVLHHCFDYRAVVRELDRVLKPGGYLMLAHEPNREFFRSSLVRAAAATWKLLGFGMRVPRDTCDAINARLQAVETTATPVSPDEILRLVEYHSPVEQGPVRIDRTRGFSLSNILAEDLGRYRVIEHTEYSTFHLRPQLAPASLLGRIAGTAARLLHGRGNLFSAVLQKPRS